MARPRSPASGGILLAIGAIGGALLGFVLGQPTLWFIGGMVLGTLAALAIWWRSR